jgi:hypothetical protein
VLCRYADITNITISIKPGAAMGLTTPALPPPSPPAPPPPLLGVVVIAVVVTAIVTVVVTVILSRCCSHVKTATKKPLLGNQESQPEGQ